MISNDVLDNNSPYCRGRYNLYEKEPFYGLFALNCGEMETKEIPTAAVCEKKGTFYIMYNPDFIKKLTIEETSSVIKHEIGHIIFGHLTSERFKEKSLQKQRLNVAMDLAINSCIKKESLPEDCCYPSKFKGKDGKTFPLHLSTMEYYYMLPEDKELIIYLVSSGMGNKNKDGKGGDDHDKMTIETDSDFLRNEIEKLLGKVYKESNGRLPSEIGSGFGEYLTLILKGSEIPWAYVYRRFLLFASKIIRKSTWKRPHRRFNEEFQGKKNEQKLKVLVAVDESGSIGNEEWEMFINEIDASHKTKMAEITVCKFTTQVEKVFYYKGIDDQIKGRFNGGTKFQPVFNLAEELKPDVIVVFTDGYNFDHPCVYNKPNSVLWCLVPDGKLSETFGKTIVIKKILPRPNGF